MHGLMHPNYWQITILLVVDLCSSLVYSMMTQPLPIAGKSPIKTLVVAKQLPTNTYTHYCTHTTIRKQSINSPALTHTHAHHPPMDIMNGPSLVLKWMIRGGIRTPNPRIESPRTTYTKLPNVQTYTPLRRVV